MLLYWQVAYHEFISLDDETYVVNNIHVATGLSFANVVWAFSSVHSGNWHPLTWVSHMLDVQIYGLNPAGHHLTNVFIHIFATVLLYVLLYRLTSSSFRSFLVACLFAIHPAHVESVAWVAERKDVLSAFFFFTTLLLYVEYVKRKSWIFYILALLSFCFGLMSKPMLVTLPVVMMLIDHWPLRRYMFYHDGDYEAKASALVTCLFRSIRDKMPFFVISLLSSVVTIYAQARGGAVVSVDLFPLALRIENAFNSYVKYMAKMVWPVDLGVYYPYRPAMSMWPFIGSLLTLIIVTAVVLRGIKRYPYLLTGWMWFLVTLLPVIGVIQVGGQSMADRYTYIPFVGLFVIIVWGFAEFFKSIPYGKWMQCSAVIVVLALLSFATWRQIGYWRDDLSLYRHTLAVSGGSYVIHYNLGRAYYLRGSHAEAVTQYRSALMFNPGSDEAYNNLGLSLFDMGHVDEAIGAFTSALRFNVYNADTRNNLGIAYVSKGMINEAVEEFKKITVINPSFYVAYNNLGRTYFNMGLLDEAIGEYMKAIAINPGYHEAQANLQVALQIKQRSVPH
jgi:hypothetical protein